MKVVICSIGLHDWKIVRHAKYINTMSEEFAFQEYRKRRVCNECGKTQEEDICYLGLKCEQKCFKRWVNVSRVEHDGNGKIDILVDGAGALIVCNEDTDRCYGLVPGNYLGTLNKQGICTTLGKYAIGYPRG